jgi:hypothetical protein
MQRRDTLAYYFRINPRRFHYLKFLLEGYDNMAVLSSVDSRQGVVRIRCPEGMITELFALLEAEIERIR